MLNASWSQVFLSQCFDHALGLLLAFLFFFAGLSLFDMHFSGALSQATPFFWVGLMGTLWACDLFCRGLGILLYGATAGNLMTKLNPVYGEHETAQFWLGQLFESFHVLVPGLWALELFARSQGSRLAGIRYRVSPA
jgi:hypothetical protein